MESWIMAGYVCLETELEQPGRSVCTSSQFMLRGKRKGCKAAMTDDTGTALVTKTAPDNMVGPSLLDDAQKLRDQQGAAFSGSVVAQHADIVHLKVHMWLPEGLWSDGATWPASPAAARWWCAIQHTQHTSALHTQLNTEDAAWDVAGVDGVLTAGPGDATTVGSRVDGAPMAGPDVQCCAPQGTGSVADAALHPFSLVSCFAELPSTTKHTLPPLPPPPPTAHQHQHACGLGVCDLPLQCLNDIISRLSPRDMVAVGATCKFFAALTQDVAPGLKLKLYPHQRTALRWMMAREKGGTHVHPLIRCLPTSRGDVYVNTATGDLSTQPPQPLEDVKGGMFCDEPGLGKTITSLALILKTKGALPLPPSDCPPTWLPAQHGRSRVGFYTVTERDSRHVLTHNRGNRHTMSLRRGVSQSSGGTTAENLPRSGSAVAYHVKAARGGRGGKAGSAVGKKRTRAEASVEDAKGIDATGASAREATVRSSSHISPAPCQKLVEDVGDDGEEEAGGDGQNWVQCDMCNKWRLLPPGSQAPGPEDVWCCHMNPDKSLNRCEVAEDIQPFMGRVVLATDGYVASASELGDPLNVEFFRKLLKTFPLECSNPLSPTWWLAQQSTPQLLRTPFRVNRAAVAVGAVGRESEFVNLWRLIGLESVADDRRKAGKRGAGGSSRRGGWRRGDSVPLMWRQRSEFHSLLLDTHALLQAMLQGPGDVEQRIYLSPATLVVVPATLIPHWLHQIDTHTHTALINVCVLGPEAYGGTPTLPEPHVLAWNYDVVITTFNRLSAEWTANKHNSSLMRIHWLRVMIDEGHMLGSSLSVTNKLQMACALRAERRWIMTGTPTPNTPSANVAHLHPLLVFLHHQPYGMPHDKTWEVAVRDPFKKRQLIGRQRLMDSLRHIMIRAAKSDLLTIPPCFHKVTLLDFAPGHGRSYNALVDIIKRNLLTSDWFDDEHNESLLSKTNNKWGREMWDNIRMSCNVAGNCNLAVQEKDMPETLEMLADKNGFARPDVIGPPWVPVDHPLSRVEQCLGKGGPCQKCGEESVMLMVTPCAHTMCTDCIATDRLACPLDSCRTAYRMQPVDDPARLEHNPNPKWEVPIDLIEVQPAYAQKGAVGVSGGEWSANWQITKSSKCVHLLKRLYAIGAALSPAVKLQRESSPWDVQYPPLTKAIVFSQFWMHIMLIAAHLSAHEVVFSVLKRDMKPANKAAALAAFQHDCHTGVLLMDENGAVGLDLSFVSHVFLLEPILDKSLQQQVISRAHRMGASGSVHVETLAMKGSSEETILRVSGDVQPAAVQESMNDVAEGGASSSSGVQASGGRNEVDQRLLRNKFLLDVHAVCVSTLPEYEDVEEEEQQGNKNSTPAQRLNGLPSTAWPSPSYNTPRRALPSEPILTSTTLPVAPSPHRQFLHPTTTHPARHPPPHHTTHCTTTHVTRNWQWIPGPHMGPM